MEEQWWDPRWGAIKPPPKPDWELNIFNNKFFVHGNVSWFRRFMTKLVLGVEWRKIKK